MIKQIKKFGSINSKDIFIFKITNTCGSSLCISNYGASIVSLVVPDKQHSLIDVVLGFDTLDNYIIQDKYIGAIIGRNCNRIANGVFSLNGIEYSLEKNNGEHNLHSGLNGIDKKIWSVKFYEDSIVCKYTCKELDSGFPGNLNIKVTYTLTDDNKLVIDYKAICDKSTIANLTNHTYFNLNGHNSGTIENHLLQIYAKYYTPTNETSIPNGTIASVDGTPFDFSTQKPICENINKSHTQLEYSNGFDHNYAVNSQIGSLKKVATVKGNLSNIQMDVFTTMPGMQFYTGNYLDGCPKGKNGAVYGFRSGLCLETQYFPNSINIDGFPKPILKKGENYNHKTIYAFS